MNPDLISIESMTSFMFIISSGYITLLLGYYFADMSNFFYKSLKDFDKATQTAIIGIIIYLTGYFLSPDLFSMVFSEKISVIHVYIIIIIEVYLIIIISYLISLLLKISGDINKH